MKKHLKISILACALALMPLFSMAQDRIETRAFFESENKIYVAVLVLTTILIGIFLILVYLEKKIKKLERQFNKRS